MVFWTQANQFRVGIAGILIVQMCGMQMHNIGAPRPALALSDLVLAHAAPLPVRVDVLTLPGSTLFAGGLQFVPALPVRVSISDHATPPQPGAGRYSEVCVAVHVSPSCDRFACAAPRMPVRCVAASAGVAGSSEDHS